MGRGHLSDQILPQRWSLPVPGECIVGPGGVGIVQADAGLRSWGGGVLGVSGGGDGGHHHARFWVQAQVVRAQWRVQVQAGPGGVQGHGQAFSALSSGLTETLLPTPEDRMQES